MPALRPALVLTALTLALLAAGCSGGDGDDAAAPATTAAPAAPAATAPPVTTAPAPPPAPAPEPLPGLPRYTAGYDDWTRLNDSPIPPDSEQTQRVGFDAHRGVKDVYVNRPRSAARGGWPDGTIVVKAAGTSPDEPTLVAIMRKVAGVDPEHGDWEFVEYKRSAPGEDFATDASLTDATCWSCHAIATGTDWVFTPAGPG